MRTEKTPLSQINAGKTFEVPWYEKNSTPNFQPSAQPKIAGGAKGVQYSQAAFSDLSMTGGLGELAKGLQSLNPALEKFQSQLIDKTNKEDILKATADNATGKEYDNKNNSWAYQSTFYTAQAQADALKMNDDLRQAHETNKQNDQETYTKAIKEQLDKWINPALRDTPDGQIRASVLSQIATNALSSFDADYRKTQLGIAQTKFQDNLYALYNKDRQTFVSNLPTEVVSDPFARVSAIGKYDRDRLDYMITTGKTQGLAVADTVMKFAKNSMAQGIQDNDPAAMEWIFKVGKDGVASTDTTLRAELIEMRDNMKQRIHQKTQLEEVDRDKNTKIEAGKVMSSIFEKLTFEASAADKLKAGDDIQALYAKINSDPTRYNPMGAETMNTLMTIKNRLQDRFAQFDDSDALRKLNGHGTNLTLEQLEAVAPKLTQNTYMMYAGGIKDMQKMFISIGASNEFSMFSHVGSQLHSEGIATLVPAGIELQMAAFDPAKRQRVDAMKQAYTAKMGDFLRTNKNTSATKIYEASVKFQNEVRASYPDAVKIVDEASGVAAQTKQPTTQEDVRKKLKGLKDKQSK